MSFFLVLALFLSVAVCKWQQEMVVLNITDEIEFVKSYAFTDNSTGKSYVAWISPTDYSVWVRIVEPDKKIVGPPIKITTTQRTTYEMKTRVTGAHDGKHIQVTFLGTRTREKVEECSEQEKRGCSDIYFSESEDGETFSAPIPIPRPDMNDAVNRFEFDTIVSWVNHRIWIVYLAGAGDDTKNAKLTMTTRPPNSKVFSNEVSLNHQPGGFFRFSLSMAKNIPILRIFWKTETKHFVLESRDSGARWRLREDYKVCEGKDELLSLSAGGRALPSYLFAYCQEKDAYYARWSSDQSATWNGHISISSELLYQEPCVTGDFSEENTYLMYIYKVNDKTVVGSAPLKSNKLKESVARDFTTLIQYPSCLYNKVPQFNLWSLSINDTSLIVTLDMNDNLKE